MPDPDLPIAAHSLGNMKVIYIYADGRTVILNGTHPYRDNNPGNLRYMGKDGEQRAKKAGAIGIDNTYAVYANGAAGEAALHAMIERETAAGKSLQKFLKKYAPPGENNFPAYLNAITTALKAKSGDLLSDLSADQRAILAQTIMVQEGWRSRKSQFAAPVEGHR